MRIKLTVSDIGEVATKRGAPHHKWLQTDIECPSGGHYLDVYSPDGAITGHASMAGSAACCACHKVVGRIEVTSVPTIFGLEEDRAVLNGRSRVY